VEDTFGNLVSTDSVGKISLSLHVHGGPPAAKLACRRNPARVSKGLASFSCSVNTAGSDFKLSAKSGKLAPATSSAFKITTRGRRASVLQRGRQAHAQSTTWTPIMP
jgi:hypothetical protein